jgi:hypothetical protein
MSGEYVNQGDWGICGFAAVLECASQLGLIKNDSGDPLTTQDIDARLGIEVAAYLKMLGADPDGEALAQEICEFSNSFRPGAPYNDVSEIVRHIDGLESGDIEPGADEPPVVAMPCAGLMDYMSAAFRSLRTRLVETDDINKLEPGVFYILGLGTTRVTDPAVAVLHKHLRHWVLLGGDGHIYSWGHRYTVDDFIDKFVGEDGFQFLSYVIEISY